MGHMSPILKAGEYKRLSYDYDTDREGFEFEFFLAAERTLYVQMAMWRDDPAALSKVMRDSVGYRWFDSRWFNIPKVEAPPGFGAPVVNTPAPNPVVSTPYQSSQYTTPIGSEWGSRQSSRNSLVSNRIVSNPYPQGQNMTSLYITPSRSERGSRQSSRNSLVSTRIFPQASYTPSEHMTPSGSKRGSRESSEVLGLGEPDTAASNRGVSNPYPQGRYSRQSAYTTPIGSERGSRHSSGVIGSERRSSGWYKKSMF